MIRENENINKQVHSGYSGLRISLCFCLAAVLLSACVGFNPELLTYVGERDQIVEDVLRRGRIYSLRTEDEQALIDLLEEPDPEVRMTALKIMEGNPSQNIYDAVLRATLDQDDDITDEAYRILLDNWEDARFAAIRGLNALSASIILSSISVIDKKESAEDGRYLLTLFSDPRKIIRSSASRHFARTGSFGDPWFQDMLHHDDPVSKLTAVETLSRFDDPLLIPEIIPYIQDDDPEIVKAALFGLAEFDVKVLPYLHNVLRTEADDDLRINVLQIVEGVLDSSSIPVLIYLMNDENERIALKSVEILLRYGADRVVPFLVETMDAMDKTALIQSFLLAAKFQDQRLLPQLAAYFTDKDPDIVDASMEAVRSFGGNASDFLLNQLVQDSPSLPVSLGLLVEAREAGLIYNRESAEYRTDNIFLLFKLVSQDDIFEYLRYVPLPSRIVTAIWSLYDIETNTVLYQKCRASARYNLYPYFYYYREWEQFLLNAEASRAASFTYLQYFFDTDEKKWLQESDMLRNTAELYKRGAERSFGRAVNSGRTAPEEELILLADYKESRLSLISRWRSLTSDIQDLGRLIFLRYSLDIETLAEEYDFFRSLPKGDFPVPENF